MANRSYFGFTKTEPKSASDIGNVKVCSIGVNWTETPLHLLLCSLDFKKYSNEKSKEYIVVTPVKSAEKVFKFLIQISQDDEELNDELRKCFKVFQSAGRGQKFGVGIFSEIAAMENTCAFLDDRLKEFHSLISASINIDKSRSGNVIKKALSILSRPRILKSAEDLRKITEEVVGEYNEPEDFTGFWDRC